MFLAIDVGNTQTSFGVFKEAKLIHHWRFPSKALQTREQIASFLLPLLKHDALEISDWKGAALCSVVPSANKSLVDFLTAYLNVSPLVIESGLQLPFKLNVREPEQVGADRLANVAYCVARHLYPSVVVDFGTATTLDVISKEGNYEGGAILPGIVMGLESLGTKTAQLPTVGTTFPTTAIGKTTAECIHVGVLLGYVEQVDGLIQRTQTELGYATDTLLTGGLASSLQPHLKTKRLQCIPDLTLEGIFSLFRHGT